MNEENKKYPYPYAQVYGMDGGEQKIDIIAIVRKILRKWYYYAFTIPIFLAIGIYVVKTSNKVYEVSATMLINETPSYNNLGESEYMKGGIRLLSDNANLLNEIGILSSYNMMKKAITRLDFDVSYYKQSFFKATEIYPTAPFKVTMVPTEKQVIGVPIYIQAISDEHYWLDIDYREEKYHLLIPESDEGFLVERPLKFSGKFKFGEEAKTDYFTIVVEPGEATIDPDDKDLKYFFILNSLDGLARAYQKKVEIETVEKEASIIRLTSEGNVAEKEIDFLNTLCQTYIDTKLEEKNAFASGTIDFIEQQLSNVTDSLQGAESQLAYFRASERTLDLGAKATALVSEKRDFENQRANLQVSLRYYQRLLRDLRDSANINSIVAPQTIGITNPLLNSLVISLKELYAEKASKSFMVNEGSLEMEILNRKIASDMQALEDNVQSIVQSTQFSIDDLDRRIAMLNREIDRLPRSELEQVKIQRRFELNDNLYNYLMQRRAEAGIQKAANRVDSRVLDYAQSAGGPISPKTMVILATAMMMAIFLSTAIILVQDFLDDKVRDRDQLSELTDINVLATIPRVTDSMNLHHPDFLVSPLSEAFRYLKVNLDYLLSIKERRQVIGVTSMVKGEGKTFTSTHLAATLAAAGKRTIILGADIRRPRLYKELKVENDIGLSNYLAHQVEIEDIVQTTGFRNLSVITSGKTPPNLSELLHNGRLEILIEELKNAFDYIVVDTPPVGLVSDYYTIAKQINLNLFVLRQDYSKTDFIKESNEIRNSGKLNNLYFIFNDATFSGGSDYATKYGKRYAYGYGDEKVNGKPVKKIWRKLVRKD